MCIKCGCSRDDVQFIKGRNLCKLCYNAYNRAYQKRKRRKNARRYHFEQALRGLKVVRT